MESLGSTKISRFIDIPQTKQFFIEMLNAVAVGKFKLPECTVIYYSIKIGNKKLPFYFISAITTKMRNIISFTVEAQSVRENFPPFL